MAFFKRLIIGLFYPTLNGLFHPTPTPLEVYEKRLYRQRVFKYSAILGIVDIILCFMEIQSMAVLFSIGILLAAGLQIPCVLKGDMEHGYGLEK